MKIEASPRQLNNLNQHNQIIVPIPPLPPNLPRRQLIEGNIEEYLEIGVPLYKASIKGDWKAAKAILEKRPELVRFAITKNYDTPLHVAVSANNTRSTELFVKHLVNLLERQDLALQNKSNDTALTLAAIAGNEPAAKIMLEKDKSILEIPGSLGMMPLQAAVFFGKADMVRYLYDISCKLSGGCWNDENRGWVLQKCVEADLFDIALKIVNEYCTKLTSNKRLLGDVLLLFAKKSDLFSQLLPPPGILIKKINSFISGKGWSSKTESERNALQFLRIILNKIGIMPNDEIHHILQAPLFVAAENGNMRFIIELLRTYPDLIWTVDDRGLSIFHVAVEHRHGHIFNLLYEIGSKKELITTFQDKNGNNMLHLVAKNAKSNKHMPGLAVQMQQELIWFKEVESMIPPSYRERKNKDGETPHDILTKDHEKLLAKSERWMKETTPQCLVGATIIATIAFTAAFTPPGGYNQTTGIPLLLKKPGFLIFVIADALSLLSSLASILILLSMFTSRYTIDDFVARLPKQMMLGFATLYLSLMTMIIAFSASCFILYDDRKFKWFPFMVVALTSILYSIFSTLQYPFLVTVFISTYSPEIFFNHRKHVLVQ